MKLANNEFIKSIDDLTAKRIEEIRALPDKIKVSGTTYYVSADGCDSADGKTPDSSWRSLSKVTDAALLPGDAVLFRRGDIFRGTITAKDGVTYAAYGEG